MRLTELRVYALAPVAGSPRPLACPRPGTAMGYLGPWPARGQVLLRSLTATGLPETRRGSESWSPPETSARLWSHRRVRWPSVPSPAISSVFSTMALHSGIFFILVFEVYKYLPPEKYTVGKNRKEKKKHKKNLYPFKIWVYKSDLLKVKTDQNKI